MRPQLRIKSGAWIVTFPNGRTQQVASQAAGLAVIDEWAALFRCAYRDCWQMATERIYDWGPNFCANHANKARHTLNIPPTAPKRPLAWPETDEQ